MLSGERKLLLTVEKRAVIILRLGEVRKLSGSIDYAGATVDSAKYCELPQVLCSSPNAHIKLLKLLFDSSYQNIYETWSWKGYL